MTCLLQVDLPRYLKGLPLPRTFNGFLKLKQDEWLYLAPLLIAIFVLLFSIFAGGKSGPKDPKGLRVNRKIQLEKEKVADVIPVTEIEEIAKGKDGKCAMCRCWKSKKVGRCSCWMHVVKMDLDSQALALQFPYCDGAHMKHNKQTGDNVGPLVLKC